MDTVQFVIVFVSITLTVLFVALGVQVFFILKEMRLSIHKINKMLDDGGKMTGAVSDTVEGMSGLVSGVKAGIALVSKLGGRKGGSDE